MPPKGSKVGHRNMGTRACPPTTEVPCIQKILTQVRVWRAEGLNTDQPTLTIWEGVIPYLTEDAVGVTLSAVRAFGAEQSQLVLHYIERRRIESRTIWHVAASRFGEPLRFGWDPAALPGWLRSCGFELVSDRDDDDLARELFPAGVASTFRFQGAGGRIAVATPRPSKDGRGP